MDHHFYSLTIKEVVRETHDTVSLVFENLPSYANEYLAGQFLTLKVDVKGESIRRAYSLCSSPATDGNMAVSIKAVHDGKMSNWILNHARAGMQIEAMLPIGNFIFQPHTSKKRWFMLYAAGSGITPIFSILKTILASETQSYVSLMYGNRTQDDIIFKDTFDLLLAKYPSRLKILHSLSQPKENWHGPVGRINEFLIQDSLEYLKPVSPFEETHVYMCGPQEMMNAIATTVLGQGVKKENIHHESFTSSVDELAKQAAVEEFNIQNRKVVIMLDGDRFEVEVPPNLTILDAALDQNIDMPYSCQSGLCTACRGKCLTGQVHMDERDGLDDQDIAEGYVLTCVGHPLTEDVVIEMG